MYAEYKKLAAYEPQDMHGKAAALRALQRLLAAALVDWVDARWAAPCCLAACKLHPSSGTCRVHLNSSVLAPRGLSILFAALNADTILKHLPSDFGQR